VAVEFRRIDVDVLREQKKAAQAEAHAADIKEN
jgi:hypothetical protein